MAGHRLMARVTYWKKSGERISVSFGSLEDAKEYAEWLSKSDHMSKPVVFDLEEE